MGITRTGIRTRWRRKGGLAETLGDEGRVCGCVCEVVLCLVQVLKRWLVGKIGTEVGQEARLVDVGSEDDSEEGCVGEGVVKGNRIGFFGDACAAFPFPTGGYLTLIDRSLTVTIPPQNTLQPTVGTETEQRALEVA